MPTRSPDRNPISFLLALTFAAAVLLGPSAGAAETRMGGETLLAGDPVPLPLGDRPSGDTAPHLRVLERRADGLRLVCEIPQLSVQPLRLGDERFHLLSVEGGGFCGAPGSPMLPTFSRLIEIPAEAGVEFAIESHETTRLEGYRPVPMQPEEGREFLFDVESYARSGFQGDAAVHLGEPAIARGRRVVPLTIAPVRYDPSADRLEVTRRIEIDIRFAGTDLRNRLTETPRRIPPSFDRLYRGLVANYEGARDDQEIERGSYVLICVDDNEVVSRLQPLVEWRMRKGYDVYLATTSETGSSASQIRNWLRDAYDTWENPPEFICLVGDAGGSYAIPAYSSNSDFEYSQLDGDDYLADAHVGRISIETLDQLELYVEKIVGYESTPYIDETDWYTEACLTGDPGASGITCVQIMQWLKIRLLEYGYTEIDTIFGSPFVSRMTSSMNEGVGIFCYRGYLGMSGFDSGDVNALQNGRKLIYAVNITCGTGSFSSGTAISESWIRAGSVGAPKGGIASIGAATAGTHTRYNNCFTYGIWRGPYWEDLWTFGESFTRGTYELYLNYIQGDPGAVGTWCRYINLMGDPGGELWTGVPRDIQVEAPESVPLGANTVAVTVSDHGMPIAGADVCLWKEGEFQVVAQTEANGLAEVPLPAATSGEARLTVTKHDHHPYLGSLQVAPADRFVGYYDHMVDDDASGSSSGNGDGLCNPTESIELPVHVRNFGTQTETAVVGILSCDDPYVTILDETEEFGDLDPGTAAWSADDFDLEISGGAPNGHLIRCGLDLQSATESWRSRLDLLVVAAEFRYDDHAFLGPGGQPDPGEEGDLTVTIENIGDAHGDLVAAHLSSGSSWVTITDAQGGYGGIGMGVTDTNDGNPFHISISADCFPGHIAPMVMRLEFSGGARDTVDFALQVGTASTSDPTGPDAYGYYAFDDTDTQYLEAPVYNWVELAPNHGGPGIDVGLDDSGGDNDDSRVVDLPFPFTFYGHSFTRATICSNGWISMGATYLDNRRNWIIPGTGAPPYLIAPMWDNLYQAGDDRVYHWFDEANHRYIVQWSRLRNNQGGDIENFELILYDPEHYPTDSGDGEIVFQYETFNNSDWLQQYSTVGIENANQTDGVCYSYYNFYGPGAATIGSGRAIRFTPLSAAPRGVVTGTVVNATNGGTPLEGATVELLESGRQLTTDADGLYYGLVPVGVYTLVASHPSFAPDTVSGVWVIQDETSEHDFALEDVLPPIISGTLDLPNTGDDVGPYLVTTEISEYSDFAELALRYNARGTGWTDVPLTDLGDGSYAAEIPGQMHGSLVKYYITAEDVGGRGSTDPQNAPWETYEFWVLPPILSEAFEQGAGDWFHYVVIDTMHDQWHLSQQQNHTPEGDWSWKFGDEADGNYTDLADGALESPAIDLDGEATLIFWHWMDAEVSQAHSGYAYDGGLVEMSVDGGPWTQISPAGGYPYLVREGSIPGPFPPETPIYSGTHDWQEARFVLGEITGAARFRFRFGSDGAVNQIGWYVDDVQLIADAPGPQEIEDAALRPTRLALHAARPSPFGCEGSAQIRFDLPEATRIRLDVVDVNGRVVRCLLDGPLPAGTQSAIWNGRDSQGHAVDSGIYFCVLRTSERSLTQRLLRIR
ncbi:MAG: hypothetical protein GF330_08325 [Candidatus Eisenbacteria bacterium]|nr:hypothetical protein [Candidatus Eisenbacteria bacterium]